MINKNFQAQVLLEYIIIIGIVTIVLFAMFHAAKRGIQSVVKITADQVGNQQSADQVSGVPTGNAFNPDLSAISGYLVEMNSATQANNRKQTKENAGDISYIYDESVLTVTNSVTNLGFSNRAN